eukprot:4586729-Alexandrium_andersonii.AAC.1
MVRTHSKPGASAMIDVGSVRLWEHRGVCVCVSQWGVGMIMPARPGRAQSQCAGHDRRVWERMEAGWG